MTLLTQSQFAAHIDRHRSYVGQLKQKGLLVMRGDLVALEPSLERIAAMKDPAKQAVADRHQQARQAVAQANPDIRAADPADHDTDSATDTAVGNYQTNRARKAHYDALAAQRDYEISTGKLLLATDTLKAIANAAAIIRQRLDSLPDTLAAPLAAETDEQAIRASLTDHIDALLDELSRQLHAIGQPGKPHVR